MLNLGVVDGEATEELERNHSSTKYKFLDVKDFKIMYIHSFKKLLTPTAMGYLSFVTKFVFFHISIRWIGNC